MSDEQQSRWGSPLSRAEAEALANRWTEGDILSPRELFTRFQQAIADYIDAHDRKTRYHTLGQVRQYMKEMGLSKLEVDIDDNLLAHTLCESVCAEQCKEKTGPDLDECFWPCMKECSPIDESAMEADPSPVEEEYLDSKFFSLPE